MFTPATTTTSADPPRHLHLSVTIPLHPAMAAAAAVNTRRHQPPPLPLHATTADSHLGCHSTVAQPPPKLPPPFDHIFSSLD
ncbi:hypothetical protein Tco_1456375 [Tanacetum coccineum]